MDLICDQVESSEPNIENQRASNLEPKSLRQRQKVAKQSSHRNKNVLLSLLKWYFKLKVHQPSSSYEISHLSHDDISLAYRQHKNLQKICTSLTKDPPSSSFTNLSNSHCLIRQSICLYAASSVILALCYLTTPSSAAPENPSHPLWVSRNVFISTFCFSACQVKVQEQSVTKREFKVKSSWRKKLFGGN